ncbi:MAG: DUF389 domain-containing protein [Anaerolineae bacterium]
MPEPLNFFKTIVVPIARPDTAPHMLEIATSLVDPDGGKVYALTVALNDAGEEAQEKIEVLKPIVAQFESVEMVTQIARSITRGILDGAREHKAEALIIGVYHRDQREVELGSVVENVIEAAPCDVIVYRTSESPEYDRVIVPLDDNHTTLRALEVGATIAIRHEFPFSAPYIKRDYTPSEEKERVIQDVLDNLSEEQLEDHDYITGRKPGVKMLRWLGENDLLVLGFSQRGDLDIEFGRDLSDVLLRRSPGPVLLYSRILEERNTVKGAMQRQLQRFNPALTQIERTELVWGARKSALADIDYSILIMMSAGLASLGLLLNSTAVIIGAMLVAPLMSPLGALSVGLASGELNVARRAAFTLIQGTLLSLVISILFGLLLPTSNPTSEMLARGTPSLLDAAIALVSGLVAAFALARKEIPVALAGVAIAAALMPPIATVGLGIAFGNIPLATGSALLFSTNIIVIVVAENLFFLWVGLRPRQQIDTQIGVALWWGLLGSLLVIVIVALIRLGQTANEEVRIESILLERLHPETVSVDIEERERSDGTLDVFFTIRSPERLTPQRVAEFEQIVEDELDRNIRLQMVNQEVITPLTTQDADISMILSENFPGMMLSDVRRATNGDELQLEVTLRGQDDVTGEQIQNAERALSDALEQPVSIMVIMQTLIQAPESTPEPTPESTAEATEE